MVDAHPLFAVSTVVTPPSPATSGTSFTVGTGEGARFALTLPYNLVVCPQGQLPTPENAEVVRLLNRTGDTFTSIARGQETSTPRAIQAGDLVYAAITPRALTDIEGAINAVAVGLSSTQDDLAATNSALATTTSAVSALSAALAAKANLASPHFTGTPTAPTPAGDDNSTALATTEWVRANAPGGGGGSGSLGHVLYAGEDYGVVPAVGTDQSPGINNALIDAASKGVGHVLLPPGPVYIGNPIVGTSGVLLHHGDNGGIGAGSQIILLPGSNCDMYQAGYGTKRGGLRHVRLNGNRFAQSHAHDAMSFHHGINTGTTGPISDGFAAVGDPNYTFEDVVVDSVTGHGTYGGSNPFAGHLYNRVLTHNCGGYGHHSLWDHIFNVCNPGNNGLDGFFLGKVAPSGATATSVGVYACKSFNNGQTPWWNGTGPSSYNNAVAYPTGSCVVGSDGAPWIANMDIPAGMGQPGWNTSGGGGNGSPLFGWTKISFTYPSPYRYYPMSDAFIYNGQLWMATGETLGNAVQVSGGVPIVDGVAPFGSGLRMTAGANECQIIGLDCQENGGCGVYASSAVGNTIVANVQNPNCNPWTGFMRTAAPGGFPASGIALDGTSSGNNVTIATTRLRSGSDHTSNGSHIFAGFTQYDPYVVGIFGSAIGNNFMVSSDNTGTAPVPSAGNAMFFNGENLTLDDCAFHAANGTTYTLVAGSSKKHFFTGSGTAVVRLPAGLAIGHEFYLRNHSTGAVTVQNSAGATVRTLAANATGSASSVTLTWVGTGITATGWSADRTG